MASRLAPANESDQTHIMPLLQIVVDSYPGLPFACVILDSGYDAEELHCDIYTELNLLPIIIRKPSMKWAPMMSKAGAPVCFFGYPTRRRGIEYNNGRTKFACYHACRDDPQECPAQGSMNALRNSAPVSNATMDLPRKIDIIWKPIILIWATIMFSFM